MYHTTSLKTPELVLDSCEFTYFLQGYEALIYVETNNFYPVLNPDTEGEGFMKYLGDDNGAIIDIYATTITRSRFCKGAIVYRSAPYLSYDTLFNYTANYYTERQPRCEDCSFKIRLSTFSYLNYGKDTYGLASLYDYIPTETLGTK